MTHRSAGYILLPVAVAIALIAVIAYLSARETAVESNLGANEAEIAQAEFIARAGMQHALRHLKNQGCGPYTDLGTASFAAGNYSASLTTSLGSTSSYRIDVDRDSWIDQAQPDSAHGGDNGLQVGFDSFDERRLLLRYDLAGIAAGSSVLSATAWFYLETSDTQSALELQRVSADWTEGDATWNSMQENRYAEIAATIPGQAVSGNWVSTNVTTTVQGWINGDDNFGLTLVPAAAGFITKIASRESSNAPYLQLVIADNPSQPATISSKGGLASGTTKSYERGEIVLYQQPRSHAEIRLDDGGGRDVLLDQSFDDRNYGDHELGLSTSSGSERRTLLYFDLPALPPGAVIESARLSLYHNSTTSLVANAGATVHRLTTGWVEGNQSGSGLADGATWNDHDGSSAWVADGGDYDPFPITRATISSASSDWEGWEIRALVEGWVTGRYENHGLVLIPDGSLNLTFASREDVDPSIRPRLLVKYGCACGQACVVPQGSGRIMMIVGDAVNLDDSDQYKKSLFESWGFAVTPIRDNESTASYDALANDSDVVFISQTSDQVNVGTKLLDLSIGVVSQDGVYNAALGVASAQALPISKRIEIVDSSHYITQPFAPGDLGIFDSPMEMMGAAGSTAPDLKTLANAGGGFALSLLDTGDAQYGGGNTLDRRVLFPIGRDEAFDWTRLNANGRLLLQRSLTWAANLDVIENRLLMVVSDPGSLSAQEDERRQLFESWGYQVELIGENEDQLAFDTAAANNPVAYIPEQVHAGNLGNKLSVAMIGVVSEEPRQNDDLGLAQGFLTRNSTQIEIVDNSHYITETFTTGARAITSSDQPITLFNGGMASGLSVLGQGLESGSFWQPSLAVIEAGGQLWGGGIAAGRRVGLPWGGTGFDIGELNDDGLTLMRRAIEWAGSTAGGQPPIAHWKLNENNGETALDSIAGHHGTIANGAEWKAGLFSGALDFDGGDDRIDVETVSDLDNLFTGGATLSGWIYARAWGGGDRGRILDKADSTTVNAGWQLGLDGSDQSLRFNHAFSGSNGSWATPAGSLQLDTWHHVALVYNSSSDFNTPAIFIDGVLQTLVVDSIPSGVPVDDSGYALAIGNLSDGDSRGFSGRLDDIKIYDRMLTSPQAVELAQKPAPVAHWMFDEGSGETAFDFEGSNDGKLEKDPVWVVGIINDALNFDGKDAYVKSTKFDVTASGISMMGWFRAEELGGDDMQLISKAKGDGEKDTWWQLGISASGADHYLSTRVKADGDTQTLTDSSSLLESEKWYFAAATYDSDSGQMRLYLDGVLVASVVHASGGPVSTTDKEEVAVGANADKKDFFHGIIDDARVYDYALSAAEILAIYDAVQPPDQIAYTERFQVFETSEDGSWEVEDLSIYGVPADAVVEIAILNKKDKEERWGGVRATGSLLERRFELTEAEEKNDGFTALTLHVQADADSTIEVYAEKDNEVRFLLLGYWTGVSYVEQMSGFTPPVANAWFSEDVSDNGLGANQVAEIVMANRAESDEFEAGVRGLGLGEERRYAIKEAESGGISAVSLMVNTGAGATVEAYAGSATEIEFFNVGYWSNPPAVYVENGGTADQIIAAGAWRKLELAPLGVPAHAVVQYLLANEDESDFARMGVREVDSSQIRLMELQEAESGGASFLSLHVQANEDTEIEWYSRSGNNQRYFHRAGWWLVSP